MKSKSMPPRKRWSFVIAAIFFLYCFGHFWHNYSKNLWLPEIIEDITLKKKNADGPLVLRDDIFDNGKNGKIKGVLQGAALLGNPEELFDAPIIKVTESAPKPIELTEKFLKKFQKIAKTFTSNSENSTDNFMLFSVINHAYLNLTSNFLCNIYALNADLHSKIFIVALQEETCKKLKKDWPKIECHWLESDTQHNEDMNWGKKVYIQILTFRARLLEELANLNIKFILFESDSIWIKEPFELIKNATTIDDADILVPLNGYPGKQKFAFDPLVTFNTKARTDFFAEMRARLEKDTTLMDQEVLNDLCTSQFKGVVCRSFEWSEIADGKWFKMGERERRQYRPAIINNNYYVGVRNKSARQALNGLWFLSPKGNCNVNKAKKQLAKYQK